MLPSRPSSLSPPDTPPKQPKGHPNPPACRHPPETMSPTPRNPFWTAHPRRPHQADGSRRRPIGALEPSLKDRIASWRSSWSKPPWIATTWNRTGRQKRKRIMRSKPGTSGGEAQSLRLHFSRNTLPREVESLYLAKDNDRLPEILHSSVCSSLLLPYRVVSVSAKPRTSSLAKLVESLTSP